MDSSKQNILQIGLAQNYGMNIPYEKVDVNGVTYNVISSEYPEGTYADEYRVIGDRLVIGTDTAESSSIYFARQYTGWYFPEAMNEVRVDKIEINEFLQYVIRKYSNQIRFDSDFQINNERFKYEYRVETILEGNITNITSTENVYADGSLVLFHAFQITYTKEQ